MDVVEENLRQKKAAGMPLSIFEKILLLRITESIGLVEATQRLKAIGDYHDDPKKS
jgi:hypothetical protein